MSKPSLHGGSVWRDAKGRITRPGDLNAVTAKSSDGRMWDVRGDNPVVMQQNAQGHVLTRSEAEGQ
jgi:hypothetical protein